MSSQDGLSELPDPVTASWPSTPPPSPVSVWVRVLCALGAACRVCDARPPFFPQPGGGGTGRPRSTLPGVCVSLFSLPTDVLQRGCVGLALPLLFPLPPSPPPTRPRHLVGVRVPCRGASRGLPSGPIRAALCHAGAVTVVRAPGAGGASLPPECPCEQGSATPQRSGWCRCRTVRPCRVDQTCCCPCLCSGWPGPCAVSVTP